LVVGTIGGLLAIGGVVWGWVRRNKDTLSKAVVIEIPKPKKPATPKEQIACDECQTVFVPKWKERETYSGVTIEYAVCPQCGFENEFEVEEDDDDDEP
jgi:RNase P subunit RPR2